VLDRLEQFVPPEWWVPVLSAPATELSKEVGLICSRRA
jgi:hypothetical protein